ncbi:peptide deformylase [Hymenobacter baengnokdamensis]|uniref:peptide deformylase n=1 Tax=Hymenobacter baengnokdamensis TaxID=2615203 RepID=UPI001243D511|nr:peptide deformylase [Hymenobacter baengnokdamensis]
MPTYPHSPPPPIMIYGQPCLRGISQAIPADYPTDALQGQIDTLFAVLNPTNALSISAPQIGLMLRLFVVKNVGAFINPIITANSGNSDTQSCPDGCISIPGFQGSTDRHTWVTLKYQTLVNGAPVWQPEQTYTQQMAYVIEHEMDHLNGILFIDHLPLQADSLGYDKGQSNLNNPGLQNYVNGNYLADYNTLPITQA